MNALQIALTSLLAISAPAWSATTFITNNSSPKSLASDESDAAILEGNSKVGTTDALTLSNDDGGGIINLTTSAMTGSNNLGMGPTSMGNGNDKWGSGQSWTFQFDQAVSFDEIDMFDYTETMSLSSSAWTGTPNTSGAGWTFDGSTGTFSLLSSAGTDPVFDFTGAGVPDVPANTDIFFGFTGGANGGERMRSFTISPATVIPEPSSVILFGLATLGLAISRRRG